MGFLIIHRINDDSSSKRSIFDRCGDAREIVIVAKQPNPTLDLRESPSLDICNVLLNNTLLRFHFHEHLCEQGGQE